MLLDSNIIIYSANPQFSFLTRWLTNENTVSSISEIEVLRYYNLHPDDELRFNEVFNALTILPIDTKIIKQAVRIRKLKSMSLGDAIIASTALIYNLPLINRNTKDFEHIEGIKLLDPFETSSP